MRIGWVEYIEKRPRVPEEVFAVSDVTEWFRVGGGPPLLRAVLRAAAPFTRCVAW